MAVVGAGGVASDCFFLWAVDNNEVASKKDRRIFFMLDFKPQKLRNRRGVFKKKEDRW